MTKYRSSQDFSQSYASNKQGIGISIENYLHLKQETTPGTAVSPSIGTQGKSTSAAAPSTDISSGTDTNLRVAVDGGAVQAVTLTVAGKNTGNLIAAELETKINAALSASGLDSRVWVEFSGGLYNVWSQKPGVTSSVVITAGLTNDVAADLKLGLSNSGVESVGTAGGDFLFMTKADMKVSQPFEMSMHRTGRQASNVIKKKIVSEGNLEMYVNMATGGSPTLDTPVSLLLESVLGNKITSGSSIKFNSAQPQSKYFSMVQGNNAFGRQFNGGYAKSMTISLPGDGEAKIAIPVKARNGHYASISKINGAVVASSAIILTSGESPRFEVGSKVMFVDIDGRTITAGADGSISVSSRVDGSQTVNISSSISVADQSYMVPWLPHVLDQHGTDNPVTGLQGTVSFDGGSTVIEEVRSVEYKFDPKLEDQDNWYGFDTNMGNVVGDRAEITVKVEMLISASQMAKIVQSKEFTTFSLRTVLGPSAGRRVQFDTPKVYFQVPDLPIPDKGSVIATFEGKCVQTAAGALDAFSMTYL